MAMQPQWRSLESVADRPEVQEQIRHEIRKGTIRVVPGPHGGIRIIPNPSPATDREHEFRHSA